MSERKAINKWYPPDYDPSKVPKKAKSTNPNNDKVRLMLPFSMKCLQCNEYIAARRKFNARKETTGERYLGFKIIKFHVKCPRCNNGIVFRTDPKLAGFAPVEGGVRNYESTAKEAKIKPMETDDEILQRLEKEDLENQKYHEQRQKRKLNPFWQESSNAAASGIQAMENLEEKLLEQQREQELHDHLTFLHAKSQRIQQSGGHDRLADEARESILTRDDDTRDRRSRDTSSSPDSRLHHKKVPSVITVKRQKTLSVLHNPTIKEAPLSSISALADYSSEDE